MRKKESSKDFIELCKDGTSEDVKLFLANMNQPGKIPFNIRTSNDAAFKQAVLNNRIDVVCYLCLIGPKKYWENAVDSASSTGNAVLLERLLNDFPEKRAGDSRIALWKSLGSACNSGHHVSIKMLTGMDRKAENSVKVFPYKIIADRMISLAAIGDMQGMNILLDHQKAVGEPLRMDDFFNCVTNGLSLGELNVLQLREATLLLDIPEKRENLMRYIVRSNNQEAFEHIIKNHDVFTYESVMDIKNSGGPAGIVLTPFELPQKFIEEVFRKKEEINNIRKTIKSAPVSKKINII